MSRLYVMPLMRAAALIRAIQSTELPISNPPSEAYFLARSTATVSVLRDYSGTEVALGHLEYLFSLLLCVSRV